LEQKLQSLAFFKKKLKRISHLHDTEKAADIEIPLCEITPNGESEFSHWRDKPEVLSRYVIFLRGPRNHHSLA
jgi:hypothetical protein